MSALRCAIYTRVSTDHGLEQEFNSLDNQREAAEAYVKSQAHEGWRLLRDRYDDGGFSGGSMERPALYRLLDQVRQKRVDVIVVYKVDRLTRSFADFAKLVELFDANGVSFVSVTQAFNTTTSMGRLTLNVLLSFAQFEREVTEERIRDKIAASKRRGLWVGGMVPLGYRVENKKLAIVETEAETVRMIFRRYLELGSLGHLLPELRERKVLTKTIDRDGIITRGGIPFTRGSLAYLLRNRFYIGEIVFKGAVYKAEHPAILERELFEAVQEKLTSQRNGLSTIRSRSPALLTGKLFDDRGHRMMPSHAKKKGVRYRYYVSRALVDGNASDAGSLARVAAEAIETLVTTSIGDRTCSQVERIELGRQQVRIVFAPSDGGSDPIIVPWPHPPTRRHREVIVAPDRTAPARSIRTETRATLLTSIAKGRRWLDEMLSSNATPELLAAREGCSRRQINATLSLASLSPSIVEAIIAGRIPHGVALRDLTDPPLAWSDQNRLIGV